MFLINTFVIVLLFMLSLSMPLTSFILPVYKIKKMKNLTFKTKLMVNVLAMLIITILNPELLIIYLGFYILIEVMYHYFDRLYTSVKKFDRIIIISVGVTIFLALFTYLAQNSIKDGLDMVADFYEEVFDITHAESNIIIQHLKNNALYYIFNYAMISVFFVYICVDFRNYSKWKVSFEWLLIYIIPFFLIHILNLSNFYTENIMKIGQVIFIFYGIKTVYGFLSKYIRFKFINNFVSFGLAITCPFALFLTGVFGAFKTDKFINND